VSDAKTEIWFYHLERSTLEQVLPGLLEKTLQKGWRALVRVTPDNVDEIDELLWTYRAESFLPHGRADAEHANRQPVLLTESGENLNSAQTLFIVDETELGDTEDFARCFIIFDGRNESSVQHARNRWRTLKDGGKAELQYWKQDEEGRWARAA